MHITAEAKKSCEVFQGQVLNILKKIFDKKLVLNDNLRISPEPTFTQVPNRNPIKTVLFLERKFTRVHRGSARFRAGFGSVHTGIVHSLSPGKVAATAILKSVPSQFSPFIL